MARVVRTRQRTVTYRGRALTWINPTFQGPPTTDIATVFNLTSQITDSVGRPVVDSPLSISSNTSTMMSNGRAYTQSRSYQHIERPISSFGASEGDLTPIQPHSGWLLDLVAGTNPSRSVVTPPELIQNLIELPKLLRETFKYLTNPRKLATPKDLANAHLAVRFGWMPFIKDLKDLLDLQSHVIKRSKELDKLYSGKGLRRRLKFADTTKEFPGSWSYALSGANNSLNAKTFTFVRKQTWGTIRWAPTSPPPYSSDDEAKNRFARKLVLGLTPEGMAKGLWNVIPWTWLLGWFTNVGKLLLANSNTVPAKWSKACFMSKSTGTCFAGPVNPSQITTINFIEITGTVVKSRKLRFVASGPVLPGFSIPFMDIGRLSVLGSLAVQRLR